MLRKCLNITIAICVMIISEKSRDVILSISATLVVLFIASLVPIWIEWRITPEEGVGYRGNLWNTVAQLSSNIDNLRSYPSLWELHLSNILFAAIVVIIATVVGLVVFSKSRKLHK